MKGKQGGTNMLRLGCLLCHYCRLPDLPDDVLLLVFSYLDLKELICIERGKRHCDNNDYTVAQIRVCLSSSYLV